MDCKTTRSTTPNVQDEMGQISQLCQQTFKSGERTAIEKYTYQNDLLVKTERINAKGELLFTEATEWSDGLMRSKKRGIADKTIFEVRYSYEKGLLKKREIDDTNEKGELVMDGKTDREETFFYTGDKDKALLATISIERKSMPIITVDIEYSDDGLEKKRTTRSDKKTLEIQKTFYESGVKTKSIVELRDERRLEYIYSYNTDGKLAKTTRTGSNEIDAQSWSLEYDCEADK